MHKHDLCRSAKGRVRKYSVRPHAAHI